MREMWIVLSFVLLLTGCYSQRTVRGDDVPNPDKQDLILHLTDGSYIISHSGSHHRMGNGYRVVGKLMAVRPHAKDHWDPYSNLPSPTAFDGTVLDEEIEQVVVKEFNTALTILAVGIPLVTIGLGLVLCNDFLDFGFSISGW